MSDRLHDPDPRSAETLPATWYRDPERFEQEQARVLARSWHLAGRVRRERVPGAALRTEVAGEPLLVVTDQDGKLHAVSAVCRHRAGPVSPSPGRRGLRCGYHGWSYDFEGRLVAAPEMDGAIGFDPGACSLPRARVEAWGGFAFVTLDPGAPPLADVLGPIAEETRHVPLEAMVPWRSVDYEVDCNWKVYVDNYLEGYHIPLVHPRLFRELDYPAYRVETGAWHSRQHAPFRGEGSDTLYAGRGLQDARYYWIFPGTMINLYPDNVQTNSVIPLGVERTRVRFEWSLLEPGREAVVEAFERAFALADEVQREDAAICAEVQRGLRSPGYLRGRYSPRRENGVHHFHGLLARALGSAPEGG